MLTPLTWEQVKRGLT